MQERLRAFSAHFLFSALIALIAVGLVFYIWYPGPLSEAVGVTEIFLLMLFVDVTLGPILTFIIYRKGKRTLKMDLAIIALLQVSAMGYGLHVVAEGRPVWLVFSVDRFDLVRAMDIDTRHLDSVAPEYQSLSLKGPYWVSAKWPEDAGAQSAITFEAVFSGFDLQHRPYLYHPLASAAADIRAKAIPLRRLQEFNSVNDIRMALERWPEADAWLPLGANAKSLVVLLNRQSARVIALVNLSPWE